ncbi:cobalt-precorrin-6A reductase [Reyranella sp.]|uniref:cobalt-precorrin-6A reductase n=1 Tax=Reyranella sp. TaxID=1929291 RepID=UPI0037838BF0
MRVLILGGTTEASALARLLADDSRFETTLSLAGRTSAPRAQPIATRVGGFGGIDGQVRYLRDHGVDAVIDATHPYAAQISAHAVAASAAAGVALASLVRPPWQCQEGDRWHEVVSTHDAALRLGDAPRRVFLSLGRQDLHVFATAPQHHYIARLIETPQQAELPADLVLLHQRGPFDLEAEGRLLVDERIEVIVSKNSGGEATYPKIAAARALALPVVMIARPDKPVGHIVTSAEEAVDWLAHVRSSSRRGV